MNEMITAQQKTKLMANWGEKAESMACYAEVRLFDPLSPWECYIYAMNPENEDEVACIISAFSPDATTASLEALQSCFNSNGYPPMVDHEFRACRASELLKQLNDEQYYVTRTD